MHFVATDSSLFDVLWAAAYLPLPLFIPLILMYFIKDSAQKSAQTYFSRFQLSA
jgi:hypothetical protein